MGVTVLDVRAFKEKGTRFAMLTAYDFPTAQALDEAGLPILLVGDTLGVFVSGHKTTLPVTMDVMVPPCQPWPEAFQGARSVGAPPSAPSRPSREAAMPNPFRRPRQRGYAAS